jgi:hypothetical protein
VRTEAVDTIRHFPRPTSTASLTASVRPPPTPPPPPRPPLELHLHRAASAPMASPVSCSHHLHAGTSPSFVVTPQCSTSPSTAPKTTGQPPSPMCPFCQGSPSWTALVSFFQSRFCPQIDSPHTGAAQAANPHSLTAGHRWNRPGAIAQCRRPSLPCF